MESAFDWLQRTLSDEQVWLSLGFLLAVGLIVNQAVNRLINAQREIASDIANDLKILTKKLDSLEPVTVNGLMADIRRPLDYKRGESNLEAIRRWLDYREDYGRSSPHRDENDVRNEALYEVFKEIDQNQAKRRPHKRTAQRPDQGEADQH
jgi:hypothetical protein